MMTIIPSLGQRWRTARTSVVTGLVAAIVALSSCAKQPESDESEAANAVETVSYTVRGIIAQMPDPQNPASMFTVRHESMPHYRRQNGELGMSSMTMPFPPAEGLSLDGWAAGDHVELSFEVDYDAQGGSILAFRATALVALPDGVQLDFSPLP